MPRKGVVEVGRVLMFDTALVHPMPGQPRLDFDPLELDELEQSIRAEGQKQPGIVKESGVRGGAMHYQLKSGERRWRVCSKIGIHFIAMLDKGAPEIEEFIDAALANLHGVNLNCLEMAYALDRIKRETGKTHEELAGMFGKKRSAGWVSQHLSLLRLHGKVRALMSPDVKESRRIVFSVGVGLASFAPEHQVKLAEQISEEELSVTEALALIRKERQRLEDLGGKRLVLRTPNRDYNMLDRFVSALARQANIVLSISNVRFREMFASRDAAEKERVLVAIRRAQEDLRSLEEAVQGVQTRK